MGYNAAGFQPVVTAPMDYGGTMQTAQNIQNLRTRNEAMKQAIAQQERQAQAEQYIGAGDMNAAQRLAPGMVQQYKTGELANQAAGRQLSSDDARTAQGISQQFMEAEAVRPGSGVQILEYHNDTLSRMGLQPEQGTWADQDPEELKRKVQMVRMKTAPDFRMQQGEPAIMTMMERAKMYPEDVPLMAQMASAMSPKTITNIQNKGDTKYAEVEGGNLANWRQEFRDQSKQARQQLAMLDNVEMLQPFVDTGPGKQTTTQIKGLAKQMGMDLEAWGITDDLPAAQAMQFFTTQFALQNTQNTKGSISEKEMALFQQAAPGLMNQPGGNQLIIDYMRRIAQRSIEVNQRASEYAQQNGGRIDDGFEAYMADYYSDNPLFSPAEKAKMQQSLEMSGGGVKKMGAKDVPGYDSATPDQQARLEKLWETATDDQKQRLLLKVTSGN